MHPATIESVYEDFTNLGAIFGVEDKADEIVTDMRTGLRQYKRLLRERIRYPYLYMTPVRMHRLLQVPVFRPI